MSENADIRNLIKNAILNFKAASRKMRLDKANPCKLSNLSLYALLCLHTGKPVLRNDIQKKLHVNYYDAGTALEILMLNGLITNDIAPETSNIKGLQIKRKRYRLTLNGECFLNTLLSRLND